MRAHGRQLPVFLLLGWTLACGVPQSDNEPDRTVGVTGSTTGGALHRAEYAERLGETAGGPVPVERIVEAATAAAARIEERMDRLAAELGEPGGWRPLFARLRLQAPADEPAALEAYRMELTRAAEFTRSRDLVSLPAAEPEVLALENASLRAHFPLALYHDGRFAVTTASSDGNDPAYLTNHCWVCIPPLTVHEGYPGHHVAVSHMRGVTGQAPSLAELARYKPFVEGWALYAEVLMLEHSYYTDLERRLGAWRMVLLRLARAEIDARLHGGGLEPAAAEEIYRQRLLLTAGAAAAEVRTHLAKPTVKASYFVGMLQILELREALRDAEPNLPLRDFHDRLLGPPAPIPRIARQRFDVELGPPGEADLPWPWSPVESRPALPPPGQPTVVTGSPGS